MSSAVLPEGKLVEVFYDSECPLCMREIAMLRRKDRALRIQFTDIASPSFEAGAYGRTQEAFLARIAGRLPDGTWLEGVEVFRRLYAAIGWRRAVAVSRWPGVSQLLELAYGWFARNRLRLTGRCADGACQVPNPRARLS